MIAVDTSVWINYSNGKDSPGVIVLEEALREGAVVLPPVVFVEILSSPTVTAQAESFFRRVPRLDLLPGFFDRTANLRRKLLRINLKAKLGDCLIAQSCIDQGVPLVADDLDFKPLVKFGLDLI